MQTEKYLMTYKESQMKKIFLILILFFVNTAVVFGQGTVLRTTKQKTVQKNINSEKKIQTRKKTSEKQQIITASELNQKGVEAYEQSDYSEAIKWFRKAAEQGYAPAQSNLGRMYNEGRGVEKNSSEAAIWLFNAAQQGDTEAQLILGYLYQLGQGVKQDYTVAFSLYQKAADKGSAVAQNNLAYMYQEGYGISQDYKEAFKWFRKSADQGDANAQFKVGEYYYKGIGVHMDYLEAEIWFRLAAEQGHKEAKSHLDIIAKYNQLDPTLKNLINNMVYVEGGSFMMGSDDSDADSDEKPAHRETVGSFSIGKYEVTQKEWTSVMGNNPSHLKGDNLPVEDVSWNDCQEFIRKLNSLTGQNFRLPTETEWEYAARGGNRSNGYKYSGSNNLSNVAWYEDNSGNRTHNIGTKAANELGLYDMSGNVWEWTSSKWSNNYNEPRNSSYFVIRGGSWLNNAHLCRVSDRDDSGATSRYTFLGLRLVL